MLFIFNFNIFYFNKFGLNKILYILLSIFFILFLNDILYCDKVQDFDERYENLLSTDDNEKFSDEVEIESEQEKEKTNDLTADQLRSLLKKFLDNYKNN